MNTYLCLKDGVVVNAIVADPAFIQTNAFIKSQYDSLIDRDSLPDPKPGIDWTYDGQVFSPPVLPE